MPCIKTGAHIFLAQYGEYAICDAFEVEGQAVAYFRIVGTDYRPMRPELHFTVHEVDNWWKDKPVSILITKAGTYTNHGYDGIPCPPVPYEEEIDD